MIKSLTPDDLLAMRKAGKVAAVILKKVNKFLKPGISTKDIEGFIEKEIRLNPGMEPAFKGFMGYPASCCVSINEEIIHG
ncbi:MAG: M24 family metallopeptidase, partial [Omnitrophica bacterium]|nr:M24 family metallopeptidase [Candidatus Omnitrophota bacterium]